MYKITPYLFSIIAGAFFASGYPIYKDFTFFLGPIIGLTILFFRLKDKLERDYFGRGLVDLLLFMITFYLLLFSWIPHTLVEFGGITAPWNYLLGLFSSLILIPQFFIFFLLLYLFKKQIVISEARLSLQTRNLIAAIFLSLLDYYLPVLFPVTVGHTLLPFSPWIGLAPIFGHMIFSFFIYWLVFELISIFKGRGISKIFLASLSLFIAFNIIYKIDPLTENLQKPFKVRVVQANIGNFMKLDSERGGSSLFDVERLYVKLSLTPSESGPIDLIIWPETAFPLTLTEEGLKKGEIPELFKAVISETHAELLTGGYEEVLPKITNGVFEDQYNSAFFFSLNNEAQIYSNGVYRKQLLIPFGETLPFGSLNPYLGKFIDNISYFKRGNDYHVFTTKDGYRFSTYICYEAMFSRYLQNFFKETPPQFLVNLTNDSWYGPTNEPELHHFLSRWPSIELGIPIIRATNTGISTVHYPDGSMGAKSEIFKEAIQDVTLTALPSSKTLYAKYGMLPLFILWLLLLTAMIVANYLAPKRI